jgi:chromosomal replication initiation ATPase DnaA
MVTMFFARRRTQMSYPEIATATGKNHSSVVLAVKRMEKLLAERGDLKWATPMGPKSMPANDLLELLGRQLP